MPSRNSMIDPPLVTSVDIRCRVCVVTAHDLIADLISAALTAHGIDVVRSADATFETVVGSHRGCDLVVICSWALPRRGRHLTRSLVTADPSTRIVVIDDCQDESTASPLLAAGAVAVIGRHVSLAQTVDVIAAASRGDSTLLTSSATTTGCEKPTQLSTIPTTRDSPGLSRREIEILQLAVDGMDTATMAQRMYISEKTVKHHLSAVYSKLGATNRTDAVVRGLRLGLVDLRAD
ncbi:MAG: LuxR C-terminal-related transcriptional regulator [Actinomycetota bacterium]